jgi:hypothetical protein
MRLTRFRLISTLVLLLAGSAAAAAVSLKHEPDFYSRAAVPTGPKRYETSNEFVTRDLFPFIASFDGGGGHSKWRFTFTQEQINSFFEEDFVRWGDAKTLRDAGILQPRVEFLKDEIRVGFRYGDGPLSTVLSYDLKVWLVKGETNVLAVEILRRRAGALPIPTQQLFKELTELGQRHNIEIEWYRHEGNPVAIIRFQSDRPRHIAQLLKIDVAPGSLSFQGVTHDPVQTPVEEQIKKLPETPAAK